MQIPKEQILELLQQQGEQGKAQQADSELPQQVDPEQHAGLLQQLGIDPQQLIAQLLGGGSGGGKDGGLGGLGGLLGR